MHERLKIVEQSKIEKRIYVRCSKRGGWEHGRGEGVLGTSVDWACEGANLPTSTMRRLTRRERCQ